MRYAYYPGCSLDATGIEYNLSTRVVARHLGVELWEIPEWNCCGASAAHNTNHLLSLALPARNLAVAEREGLDVAVPCAACFNRLKATEAAVRESAATRDTINQIIEMDYNASNNVRALLEVMVQHVGLEAIGQQVKRPLTDLKAAAYYGCLLLRPPELTKFDDPENPQTMDQLLQALGGSPVAWGYKNECCGASHVTTLPVVGGQMVKAILADARAGGAECLVTACPLCQMNLDMKQANGRDSLPVFYFTELMGLALGYSPKELGLTRHFVNPLPLLEAKELMRHPSTRREEA